MFAELRVLIFIDLANAAMQAKASGRRLDLVKLVAYLANPDEGRRLVDAYLYATLPPEDPDRVARWHDFLRHSGLIVVAKRAKRLPNGEVKGNIDSLLVLDAVELAITVRPDVVVLVSGDGDFGPLALRLRRHGIRTEAASGTQGMASELRAAVNGVTNLDDFIAESQPLDQGAEQIGNRTILEPL